MERFTLIVVSILIGLLSTAYASWLLYDIFNWFVVPALDVGPINHGVMWGLTYFLSFFFTGTNIQLSFFEIKSLGTRNTAYETMSENVAKTFFLATYITVTWCICKFIILSMV